MNSKTTLTLNERKARRAAKVRKRKLAIDRAMAQKADLFNRMIREQLALLMR